MKNTLLRVALLFSLTLICVGCYQASSNGDDDLITVPITNNPSVIPEGAGFGPPGAMPY